MNDRPKPAAHAAPEVAAYLAAHLPHWRLQDGTIRRVFRTHSWKATLLVVNTIGHLAEAAWHHPDLIVSYASVEVRLCTHDAQGITENDLGITDKDFALARKIEEVVAWRPARDGGPLEGTPAETRHAYIKYDP